MLVLENPGLRGQSSITQSLYAGLQLILPGEVAPAHRHTQSALRFIVEGEGAYTAVDGERTTMRPGDFIITPSWTWHDHGNDGDRAGGLARRPRHPDACASSTPASPRTASARSQQVARPGRRQPGALRPQHGAGATRAAARPTSPIFNYPYARSREALEQLAHAAATRRLPRPQAALRQPGDRRLADADHRRPSCSCCRRASRARRYRATDGAVYVVVEGSGRHARSASQRFDCGPRDIFVVPSWATVAHRRGRRGGAVQLLRPPGAAGAGVCGARTRSGPLPRRAPRLNCRTPEAPGEGPSRRTLTRHAPAGGVSPRTTGPGSRRRTAHRRCG